MRKTARARGYDHRWQRIRAAFLAEHPLCSMCAARGLTTPASVVDHVIPHRGDPRLFYDVGNLSALCKTCHDSHKQRQEKGGGVLGCDVNGFPLDANQWR